MRDKLTSCTSKLRWAKKKLASINNEISQFLAVNEYRAVREHDAQAGTDVLRLKLDGMPPIPDDVAHLIGEYAVALNATLDHIVCACSRPPNSKDWGKVAFPVFKKAPEPTDKTAWRGIAYIPIDAANKIKGLQPYHASHASKHPLWRIKRLANIDKHRNMLVVPHGITQSVAFGPNERAFLHLALTADKNDDVVLPIPFFDALQSHVDFKVQPGFGIVLENADDDTGVFMMIQELEELYNFVRDKVHPALRGYAV